MREGSRVLSLAGIDVLTMPTKVAAQEQESPLEEVFSRVHEDPPVKFAQG